MYRKKITALMVVLTFGLIGQLPGMAQTESQIKESLISFDKMMSMIKVDSVVGEPIKSGKSVVFPLAKIKFGLGAGGSMMGYGGGMGGKTIPYGLLIIEGEDVRVELFPVEEKKPSALQEMLPELLKMLPELLGGKFPFPSKPTSAKPKAGTKSDTPKGEVSLDAAKNLIKQEQYSEALDIIDALIAKNPDNAEYHAWRGNAMGGLAVGNPVNMMKYGMGAMQAFEQALELDPNNPTAHLGRGIGRMEAPEGFGGDLDGAIEDFGFVCGAQPANAEAYYYLGLAYLKKGDTGKAKEALQKALEIRPDFKDAAKAYAEIK